MCVVVASQMDTDPRNSFYFEIYTGRSQNATHDEVLVFYHLYGSEVTIEIYDS